MQHGNMDESIYIVYSDSTNVKHNQIRVQKSRYPMCTPSKPFGATAHGWLKATARKDFTSDISCYGFGVGYSGRSRWRVSLAKWNYDS